MNKEIDKEMYKSMTGILKKINESDLEQLENMEIVPNDSERVHIKRGNGKLIFVVPKAYCYMLEQAIEQEIEKKRNLDKQYEAETEGTIEEIFWSGEKKARVSSTISDAKVRPTRSYLRKVKGEDTREKGENSKKERRNIKSEPKTISNKRYYDKEKKIRRILAAIAAGIVFIGGYIAWLFSDQNQVEVDSTPTTQVSATANTQDEIDEVKNITSFEAVMRDFKETFITKYNEKYGTDYSVSDVNIYRNYLETGLYKTEDGKLVTSGYDYRDTEAILGQNNKTGNPQGVIQLVINEGQEGEMIITYSKETGDYIISGNSKNIQRDLENEEIPTLESLGIDIKQIQELFKVIESKELGNQQNLKDYIEIYSNIVSQQKVTDGFEMVD